MMKHPLFASEARKISFTPHIVTSAAEIAKIVAGIKAHGCVSIDTETTAIEPRRAALVGISLAVDEHEAWYLPVGHHNGENLPLDTTLSLLRPVLEDADIVKIGQNLKYDYQIFKNYGIAMNGIEFDCMIAAYLIDPGKRQYNLERLAEAWLSAETIPIEALIGKGKAQKSFAETDIAEAAAYSGEDVVLPIMLKKLMEPQLAERALVKLFREIEMPLVPVLAELEWHGVLIDTAFLHVLSKKYRDRIAQITAEVYGLAGVEFNLNSPKQVSDTLFHTLHLPRSKKTKVGSFETNVDVSRSSPLIILSQKKSWTTARRRNCSPPISTRCPKRSTRRPAACTPRSTRPWRRQDGCRAPRPICRTFRYAPRKES